MRLALRYAARTDVGLGPKTRNEDSGYAGPHLLAIADGMGGTVGGDVASAITIKTVRALDSAGHSDPLRALRQAAVDANSRIAAQIQADPHLEGMGTTLTAILFQDGSGHLAHIGDSRAYLLRGGQLKMITKDHTFVQTLIDEGRITPEEAEHHPHRSLIMRALEGRQDARPDTDVIALGAGDRILVCSDGLDNAAVKDDVIADVLIRSNTPEEAAHALIALALDNGSPDNVTCVVAYVVEVDNGTGGLTGVTPDGTLVGTPPEPIVVGAAAGDADVIAEHTATHPTVQTGTIPAVPPSSPTTFGPDGTPVEEPDLEEELRYALRPPSRFRWAIRLALVVVVIGVAAAGLRWAYNWTQSQYYVGAYPESAEPPESARVAIFRGIAQRIPGISLSSVYEAHSLTLDKLPDYQRKQVTDTIPADSLSGARQIVARLRKQAESCAPQARPAPSPSPSTPAASPSRQGTPNQPGRAGSNGGPQAAPSRSAKPPSGANEACDPATTPPGEK